MAAGEVINYRNISALFERDPSDPLRVKFVRWLGYVDPNSQPLTEIADELLEMAQIADGMLFMLVGMILTPRAKTEFPAVYEICQLMIEDGNEFSKFTGLKWLEFILYIEDIVTPEYIDYLETALLRWANENSKVTIYGEELKVPLLLFGIMLECRNKETDPIRFVSRALRVPWGAWGTDPNTRISYAIHELREGLAFSSGSKRVSPIPYLETIKQWLDDPDPEIQSALAAALANFRQVYPNDVDNYLQDAPRPLVVETYRRVHTEATGRATQRAVHMLSAWIMTTPPIRKDVMQIMLKAGVDAKDATDVIRGLAAHFFHIRGMEAIAGVFVAGGVSSESSEAKSAVNPAS